MLFALVTLMLSPLSTSAAEQFSLTQNGQPAATIIIAKDAAHTVKFAATELNEHIRAITGIELPIATDDANVAGPQVLIGESTATRTLGITSDGMEDQEHMIRFVSEDTLVLLGPDADEVDGVATAHTPAVAGGKFGNSRSFDGVHSLITHPDCKLNDSEGTYEAWVYLAEDMPRKHATILRIDGSNPWSYHILQRDMDSNRIVYATYDGENVRSVGTREDVKPGWHHVMATWSLDANKIELFLDGVSQGTNEYRKTTCRNTPIGIGGLPTDSSGTIGNPFVGEIDEVRVSSVVRDPATDGNGGPYTPDEHTVFLYHFDEDSGNAIDEMGGAGGIEPPALFGKNGSLYAVYDFLERYCDVRWYAPGKVGLCCPSTPNLAIEKRDLQRKPVMIHRWVTPTSFFMPGPPDTVSARDLTLWKHHMRIGGQPFWVCHSFEGYPARFAKEHPDWFAQGYDGRTPQVCFTNPEVVAQVAQDARDFFDGKGAAAGSAAMGDVFGIVPGDNNQWCKCEKCQALLDPENNGNGQFSNGVASNYVFQFVNAVAREVKKTHPDKWIGALAYWEYAYYPYEVGVEPNVVVQTCLHTRNWWCPSMEVNDTKVLTQWREASPDRPLYLWLYYNFPALNALYEKFTYFPGYNGRQVIEQMKLYHDNNFRGIFMEHSSEFGNSYLMDQVEFYLSLKLADDPTLGGKALYDEFFTRYYGAAAAPMKAFYELVEDTFTNPANYPEAIQTSPQHQHQSAALAAHLYTPERMTQLENYITEAEALASTPLEKERIAIFKAGQWDYMKQASSESRM